MELISIASRVITSLLATVLLLVLPETQVPSFYSAIKAPPSRGGRGSASMRLQIRFQLSRLSACAR
jgi:hypothetical protein